MSEIFHILLTVLAFLVIFSLLVLIHEFGHFFTARRAGIKVEEFGFGIPPRIWGVKKGETLYSLNAIPFGGFVRLLGEDARDAKAQKNPRSFSNKPIRTRIMVIVAGVSMNFLLAIVLLTIGFSFGIQPLLTSEEDVIQGIQTGMIEIQPGAVIKEVKKGSSAEQAGLFAKDTVLSIKGEGGEKGKEFLSVHQLFEANEPQGSTSVQLEILRGNEKKNIRLAFISKGDLGLEFEQFFPMPRLKIYQVLESFPEGEKTVSDPLSVSGGFLPGDILIRLNGLQMYTFEDYQSALEQAKDLQADVLRDGRMVHVSLNVPQQYRTIISDVFSGTPAEKAGFVKGDLVISVNGQEISLPTDVISITKNSGEKAIIYQVIRNGLPMQLNVVPAENGLVGIGLTPLLTPQNNPLVLFNAEVPTSIVKIKDVKYPIWQAPIKALEESGRLSVLTVQMFENLVKSLVTRLAVPEGVSGPIGIARMTYTFVQEGVLSLMRFMALLSLSLAIINVLPFPALDGGRLLFIILEVILGRRVPPKYETMIHAIGFLLLMLLILAVSFSDVLQLF